MTFSISPSAEVYFRTYLHTTIPLHAAIIDEMAQSASPPLELATVIEDIGHSYQRMAQYLNGHLIRRSLIDKEPESIEDFTETRVAEFVNGLLASAGSIVLADGSRLDGRAILEASATVSNAMTTEILIALSKR